MVGERRFLNCFSVFSAFLYFPFFLLGYKLRQYNSKLKNTIPPLIWIETDVLIFFAGRQLPADRLIDRLLSEGVDFVLHIVGALMAFFVFQKLAGLLEWKSSKLFRFFSSRSVLIYLLHQQVIYVSIYLFNGVLDPLVHVLVNVLFAIFIPSVISLLLNKYKWFRVLTGSK